MSVQGICTPLGHRRAWNWSFGGKKPSEEQPEATSFETEIIDHVPESEAQGDSAEAPVDSGTAYQDTFVDEAVEGGGSKSLIAFAKVNRIPVSPKKVHELMLRVRGLGCQEAMIQMKLSRKGNAKYIHGLIQQAVGNAVHNFNMNQDRLVISKHIPRAICSVVSRGDLLRQSYSCEEGFDSRTRKSFSYAEEKITFVHQGC